MDRPQNPDRSRFLLAAAAVFALVAPEIAFADLICPPVESTPVVTIAAPELVELVLSTVLRKGVAVLLLSAGAIVGLPWLAAGAVAALFSTPGWLRTWW